MPNLIFNFYLRGGWHQAVNRRWPAATPTATDHGSAGFTSGTDASNFRHTTARTDAGDILGVFQSEPPSD